MYKRHKKKVYEQARKKFGEKLQMLVAVEECSELQKEIIKFIRGRDNLAEMSEEIADVEIMLEQLKLMYKLDPFVENMKKKKIDRLAERVKG